jgi:hypothetical protein
MSTEGASVSDCWRPPTIAPTRVLAPLSTAASHAQVPTSCTGVPRDVLAPADAWGNDEAYGTTLTHLARLFVDSFKQYLEVREPGAAGWAGRCSGEASCALLAPPGSH